MKKNIILGLVATLLVFIAIILYIIANPNKDIIGTYQFINSQNETIIISIVDGDNLIYSGNNYILKSGTYKYTRKGDTITFLMKYTRTEIGEDFSTELVEQELEMSIKIVPNGLMIDNTFFKRLK